jgi:hypothetical protein
VRENLVELQMETGINDPNATENVGQNTGKVPQVHKLHWDNGLSQKIFLILIVILKWVRVNSHLVSNTPLWASHDLFHYSPAVPLGGNTVTIPLYQ